jgi:hypothetical protein
MRNVDCGLGDEIYFHRVPNLTRIQSEICISKSKIEREAVKALGS